MKTKLVMTWEELEAIEKEMRSLRHKAEVANFYHHQVEEFDTFKMEHVFMKI